MMGGKIENGALLSWYWSINSANNERSGYSQVRAHPLYPGFSVEILIKHLQLHLLCLGGSQFKNNIKIALGPSGHVWS